MTNKFSLDEVLKSKGYKLTQQRKVIIDVLESSSGPHTANDIFSLVSDKNSGINFSTIYRNLELLVRLGIVRKLNLSDGYNHFELTGEKHHHHVICNKCGEVKKIDICPFMDMDERDKLEEIDFQPTEHKFEIYGLCSRCRNKE